MKSSRLAHRLRALRDETPQGGYRDQTSDENIPALLNEAITELDNLVEDKERCFKERKSLATALGLLGPTLFPTMVEMVVLFKANNENLRSRLQELRRELESKETS